MRRHKLGLEGSMQDYAMCGVRQVQFRFTGEPTKMSKRWVSVTCRRCLKARKRK
jgi:hypothetical protein